MAVAALQLTIGAGAPLLEAAYGAAQPPVQEGVVPQPSHSHDASTCLVCRLLDSPAQIQGERDAARAESPASLPPNREVQNRDTFAGGGYLSRAPPAQLS